MSALPQRLGDGGAGVAADPAALDPTFDPDPDLGWGDTGHGTEGLDS